MFIIKNYCQQQTIAASQGFSSTSIAYSTLNLWLWSLKLLCSNYKNTVLLLVLYEQTITCHQAYNYAHKKENKIHAYEDMLSCGTLATALIFMLWCMVAIKCHMRRETYSIISEIERTNLHVDTRHRAPGSYRHR